MRSVRLETGARWAAVLALGVLLAACETDSGSPGQDTPGGSEATTRTAPSEGQASYRPFTDNTDPAAAPVAAAPKPTAEKAAPATMSEDKTDPGAEIATLGAGCFWCIEAVLEQIEGVKSVVSGYMGGHVPNPTYEQICSATTGHAEVVQVEFDPKTLSFGKLLEHFWKLHDPTTLNRQGNDVGPQYRSAIFYHSPQQKKTAEESKEKFAPAFSRPIVTEITEASTFYKAEDYHQNYYELNKSQPYCRFVIAPKLDKLGLEK